MIETGLVYIYSLSPARAFKGCGALLEGGYVATCRHVWRIAAPAGQKPEVEIVFPRTRDKQGALVASRASMADDCEGLEVSAPDLVLLKPLDIPAGVEAVPLSRHRSSEVGAAYVLAGLMGLDENKPKFVRDVPINGKIADYKDAAEGMRKFTGDNLASFFSDRGASGSPIFLENGHNHAAGILVLSVRGANDGKTHLREAFVLPATTIIRFLGRHLVKPVADELGIDLAILQPQIDGLCAQDHVPTSEFAAKLRENVAPLRVQAAKEVPASNDGADIAAAIKISREKLGAFDTAGALDVLQPKIAEIAEEVEVKVRRLVPLLKERAAVERLAFDYDAAKQSLAEVARLAPDDVWAFIGLGDLYVTTGPLDEAAKAFRGAGEAAGRQGNERDLSVSYNKLGDVLVAQGDLAGALKPYRDSLAIRDKLAKADPGNAQWQYDLGISNERIGDIQMAQGDLASALKSYEARRDIISRLAKSDPGNAGWQRDLSVSYDRIGNVQVARGDLARALKSFSDSLAIRDRLAKADPGHTDWQRDLSVSNESLGDIFLAQSNLPAALEHYGASLNRMVPIRDRDPSNADLQRFTSVTFAKLASVHKQSGDAAKARDFLRQGQAIMARLTKLSPDNAVWARDLAWFDGWIAELAER
jgi:tetratricopeptide (TPR) repeat protein